MRWPDVSLPDETTFQDAIEVLEFYDLWDAVPEAVRNYLLRGNAATGAGNPEDA